MRHGGPFNSVRSLMPKRHFHNLSHSKPFCCDFGELIPALHLEVVPGDKFKIRNEIVIRTQPLFAPILQEIKVYTEYFFVPNRLVFEDWEKFITGGKEGDFSTKLPLWNNLAEGESTLTFSINSLADLVGLPTGVAIPRDDVPNALFQKAYNLIWNEYYRDETIDDEVSLFNDKILKRRWKKDYFTSALPFQQRGTMQSVPVHLDGLEFEAQGDHYPGFVPAGFRGINGVYSNTNTHQSSTPMVNLVGRAQDYYPDYPIALGDTYSGADLANKRFGVYKQSGTTFNFYNLGIETADLNDKVKVTADSAAIGFTIAEFMLSNQIQRFLERNARSGFRLNDFLLSHFGLSPLDSVLQRPQFIGGSRSNLLVSEVLQTSESTAFSPQGRLAGRGLGVSSDYISTYTVSEHGYIIGLFSVVPQCMYDSQGIGKEWTRRSAFDFYFPEFAHLCEQPVKKREIMVTSSHTTNDSTFGFQPIYQEYRHKQNIVTSYFRNGQIYENWLLSRHFSNVPSLSSEFLEVDCDSARIFAVNSVKPLMVNFGNIVKSLRPIPISGDPGLFGHF